MVLGFFQVADGLTALSGYRSSLNTAFSLLELIWFLVTLVFVLAFQKQHYKIFVPLIYIVYYVFSWLYGSYLLTQREIGIALQLPMWFMVLASSFGAIYCASAFRAYKQWFAQG